MNAAGNWDFSDVSISFYCTHPKSPVGRDDRAAALDRRFSDTFLTAFCKHRKLTEMAIKTLGQRIRELRDQQDLSLREFAKKLGGLSAAFLSDIELGRRFPSDEVLQKMAPVLDTTIDDLRQYDSRPPVEELKRMAEDNPAYGFAFRKMVERRVSPEEIEKFLEEKFKRDDKQ